MSRPRVTRLRFARLTRSGWLCAVMLLTTFCNLMLGMLGGFSVVSHSHDGHGVHWHAARTPEAASILAAAHREAHRSDPLDGDHADHAHDCPGHVPQPGKGETPSDSSSDDGHGDLLVTVPDHEQVNRRTGETVPAANAASVAATHLPVAGVLTAIIDVPAERVIRCTAAFPRHLCALRTSQRLVATSRALLI